MYSKELSTTFDNAAGLIGRRLKHLSGVENVLNAVRDRIAEATDSDPVFNPGLKIDPAKFSQRAGAPRATVEAVMAELRRFNLAHLWARASCPVDPEDVDSVLIETDSAADFRRELAEGCHVCGGRHDHGTPPIIETFFALNIGDAKGRFKLRRFLLKPEELLPRVYSSPRPPETPKRTWCQRFFRFGAGKPVGELAVVTATVDELAVNAASSAVPSSKTLVAAFVILLVVYPVASVGIVAAVNWIAGPWWAVGVSGFLLAGAALTVYVALRFIFVISTARRLISLANLIVLYIFLKSQFDFSCEYKDGQPLTISFGTAKTDVVLVCSATVVLACIIFAVVKLERPNGNVVVSP